MAIELAEYLDRETGTEEQDRFVVDDEQKANWALRKIKQLQGKIDANAALAAEEVARVEEWKKEVNGTLQQSIDFFAGLLEEYHRGVYAKNPDIKTIKLPYGQLKMRAQQPEFKRDNSRLLAWLEGKGEAGEAYIKITKSPQWGQLKKKLEIAGDKMVDPDTGEIVDGVEVVEREPKFYVEVK